MILLACDLDNTLIRSHPQVGDVPVEYYGGKVITSMSARALELIANLDDRVVLVPATSRSIEQYRRVNISHERAPLYAVVSGGGVILRDNKIDEEWDVYRKSVIDAVQGEFERLFRVLQDDVRVEKVKIIDDSFIFAKSASAQGVIDDLEYGEAFSVLRHNEKIYVLPQGIDKGTAITEVASRLDADCIIAAGDSDLDVPLLNEADYALAPSRELAAKIAAKSAERTKSPCVLIKPETADFSAFIMKFAADKAAYDVTLGNALFRCNVTGAA
ncbi:MAG: HAD hydrolase family protein [Treponema sp.]|jgi:hydroxymethylpyrimidine pyrophosphatase-like HAD family hydrolase|nr:HAD hydrolase family protein [Treponema sp.]